MSSTALKLYGIAESGNSYKVALFLNLAGAYWESETVHIRDPEAHAAFVENVNELGEIPVLEKDGVRLSQSGVILTWLADHLGKFGGKDETERLEILRWILFDNHRFSAFHSELRRILALRKEPESPVTEYLREHANAAFGILERHLEGRQFVATDRPTIADLSLVGYLYYDDELGIDWSAYPNITAWKGRISEIWGWSGPFDLLPRIYENYGPPAHPASA